MASSAFVNSRRLKPAAQVVVKLMKRGGPAWTSEALASPHSVADKSGRVRRMFNGIAPRYALINSLFSFGCDARWRRQAVDLASPRTDDRVVDIACGTGDFARAFTRVGSRAVVGCDFAHEMLKLAAGHDSRDSAGRSAQSQARDPVWCEADALCLPFRSGSFSIASCAFGVRNFQDLDAGLVEMYRVLRPGGRAVILEFTRPKNPLARGSYTLYSEYLMPVAATLIAGDRTGAYRYLPRSVVSFLDAEQMCARLRQAGFVEVTATPLTMGIVTVYVAERGE